MDILIALGAIAAIGITYGLLPVGLSVFADFRKPKEVICPENGEPARSRHGGRHLRCDDVGGWYEQTPPGRMFSVA
jgi:hypothetical protein